MSVVAIICEYNPFHEGHRYQIDKIREDNNDATIVAIMSGNVVQRGELAFIDKYTRAKIAVENGADLVLELPYPYSGSTAEIFATAGVKIASSIGADTLYFGTESDSIEKLEKIASTIDSEEYEKEIKNLLKNSTESFPVLREMALKKLGVDVSCTSNDMLAIEYIRAIKKNELDLNYKAIKRVGAGYNDHSICNVMSASAIRNEFYKTGKILSIPDEGVEFIKSDLENGKFIDVAKLEDLLLQQIILRGPKSIEKAFDCPNGIGYYIYSEAKKCTSSNELSLLSSKNVTSARIRRILLCFLFGVEHVDKEPKFSTILATNQKGKNYLNKIKKTTKLPLITKHSDTKKLSSQAIADYELSLKADELYQLLLNKPNESEIVYKKCLYLK